MTPRAAAVADSLIEHRSTGQFKRVLWPGGSVSNRHPFPPSYPKPPLVWARLPCMPIPAPERCSDIRPIEMAKGH